MDEKTVYLLRGLPSCGKSHLASRLVGEDGVLLETDAFFHSIPSAEFEHLPRPEILEKARQWNYERYLQAVEMGRSPIVVDRGNGLTMESYRYICEAKKRGYNIELREPDSPWWQEIRVLLKYKEHTRPVLDAWAAELAAMNQATHGVPEREIRKLMDAWKHDLTVQDILDFGRQIENTPTPTDP